MNPEALQKVLSEADLSEISENCLFYDNSHDLNPQSSALKVDALSVWPLGIFQQAHTEAFTDRLIQAELSEFSEICQFYD